MMLVHMEEHSKGYLVDNFEAITWSQRAEAISNKISKIINKIHTELNSVLQGFQKCIA